LKSLHEVVVRNRLEQLRKRQRDEALQAQEELLAGVVRSRNTAPIAPVITNTAESSNAEEREPYDRSMSPPLLDITRLRVEERQIDILTAEEDRRALVCYRPSHSDIDVTDVSVVQAATGSCCSSVHTENCAARYR
jgi:chorismate synthase